MFIGTRAPLENVIDYLEGGYTIDEFLDDFPSVSRDQAILGFEQARDLPAEPPRLEIVSSYARTVVIRLSEVTSERRGKPVSGSQAVVFTCVGENPPADFEEWKFEANTSRTTHEIDFPVTLVFGSTVWIAAYWQNARNESGPSCRPMSVWFGAAGVGQAEAG